MSPSIITVALSPVSSREIRTPQLGDARCDRIDPLDEIGVSDQELGIRLHEIVGEEFALGGGVDGNGNRAEFAQSEVEQDDLGLVLDHERDVHSRLHAEFRQAVSEPVRDLVELAIGYCPLSVEDEWTLTVLRCLVGREPPEHPLPNRIDLHHFSPTSSDFTAGGCSGAGIMPLIRRPISSTNPMSPLGQNTKIRIIASP